MISTKDSVLSFIKAKTGIDANDNTIIFEDLGIDGLDARLFMEEFSEQYDINLENFILSQYCFSEYEVGNIFLTLYRALFDRKKIIKKHFYVSHLYKVIELGKWVEP
jgi:hypothetical protein